MALSDLLAEDLLRWMDAVTDGVPRCVLLWLDPERQFGRLVPHVEPVLLNCDTQLLRCEPADGSSQLRLKLALLRLEGEANGRTIVYLPGFDRDALEPRSDGRLPALWSVYEYRFKGCALGSGRPL